MRKRNVSLMFRMTETEAMELDRKVKQSGLSREAFIRAVLNGYILHEKPDKEFYDVMRQMNIIGTHLHQISTKANVLGLIDAPYYKKEADRWTRFQLEIKQKFLLTDKV